MSRGCLSFATAAKNRTNSDAVPFVRFLPSRTEYDVTQYETRTNVLDNVVDEEQDDVSIKTSSTALNAIVSD